MALPQDRYIKITSGEGTVETTERSLQALVITDGTLVSGSAKTFDESTLLKYSNATAVGTDFGASSKEHLWAVKYFSYISPAGDTPSRLTFAKHVASGDSSTDDFAADFNRVAGMTNEFACFTFLTETPPTAAQVKAVAAANSALNYRYLFLASLTNADVAASKTVKAAAAALAGESGTNGTEIVYQRKVVNSGSSLSVPKTYIPAAIVSAIDWDAEDGSVNMMFRQITGEEADVISESAVTGENASQGADDLDAANVDYYGLVQTNGTEQAFFQRGFNSDGESTLVYVGELWLKSRITSRLMSMFLSSNKVPANADGNARVFAEVDAVCTDAVRNGVIEVGKSLSVTARTNILGWTRDSEAADKVEDSGYWLKCWIVKSDDGKGYVAKYLLVYGKGDAIIKVEGKDTFV